MQLSSASGPVIGSLEAAGPGRLSQVRSGGESLAAGAQDPSGSPQLGSDLTLGMGRQKDLKGQGFGQTFKERESEKK